MSSPSASSPSTSTRGLVRVDTAQDIATVTLGDPSRRNAMTLEGFAALRDTMRALSADDGIRCVILRGAGDEAFCAGADISEFPTRRMNAKQAMAYADVSNAALAAVRDCRHPTIAAIRGICVGGGLELASMCDLRICGASSRFGIPVNRLGLVVSHAELSGLLRITGPAEALEILLEGRVFDAAEALQKRLVNRIEPDERLFEAALASARRIARGAPLVARWHKQFIRRLADPAPLTEAEIAEGYACFDTADFQTGYRAFLDKAQPAFQGA